MHTDELIQAWKAEEQIAHIHGWDFSHMELTECKWLAHDGQQPDE